MYKLVSYFFHVLTLGTGQQLPFRMETYMPTSQRACVKAGIAPWLLDAP